MLPEVRRPQPEESEQQTCQPYLPPRIPTVLHLQYFKKTGTRESSNKSEGRNLTNRFNEDGSITSSFTHDYSLVCRPRNST